MFEPTVGIGPTMIIQAGNFRVMAYDRNGQEQWRARLNNDPDWEPPEFSQNYFWQYPDGTPLPGNGGGDVRVLYDQFAGRFILMSMSATVDPLEAALYLAISKDSTATDHDHTPWDKFYIQIDDGHVPPPGLAFHFGGLSVDQQVIYISSALGADRHVLQILKRPPPPPWQYDPNFYQQDDNHRQVEISVEGTDPGLPLLNRLPMPAHFFGTMTPNTLYLVQLAFRGQPGPPPKHASIRFTGATVEPTGTPVLVQHTVQLQIPGADADVMSLMQLCPSP